MDLQGNGPSTAARLIGDVGDIRFPTKGHFASWNGTAPIDASSGDNNHHRLSRSGNRRLSRVLHIMAIVQLRNDTEGRRYYARKKTAGKSYMEALRCLKRRLSDVVYRQMAADADLEESDLGRPRDKPAEPTGEELVTGPGGHVGATTDSSAADSYPDTGPSVTSRTRHDYRDHPPPSPQDPALDIEGSHERERPLTRLRSIARVGARRLPRWLLRSLSTLPPRPELLTAHWRERSPDMVSLRLSGDGWRFDIPVRLVDDLDAQLSAQLLGENRTDCGEVSPDPRLRPFVVVGGQGHVGELVPGDELLAEVVRDRQPRQINGAEVVGRAVPHRRLGPSMEQRHAGRRTLSRTHHAIVPPGRAAWRLWGHADLRHDRARSAA